MLETFMDGPPARDSRVTSGNCCALSGVGLRDMSLHEDSGRMFVPNWTDLCAAAQHLARQQLSCQEKFRRMLERDVKTATPRWHSVPVFAPSSIGAESLVPVRTALEGDGLAINSAPVGSRGKPMTLSATS